MSAARIIGLGQPLAGDDGVGIAVVAYLRRHGVGTDIELREATATTALIDLVIHRGPVVIVDALLESPAGCVREVGIESLDEAGASALSGHGVGLRGAIALARTLMPERVTPRLHLVGVTIARPQRLERRLSLDVSSAIPCAAAAALTLAMR